MRRRLLFGGGAVLLLVLVLFSVRKDEAPTKVAPPAPSSAVAPTSSPPPSPMMAPPLPSGASTGMAPAIASALVQQLETPEGMKDLLAKYLAANRFPPDVIRLNRDMVDVLSPNKFQPTTVPYFDPKDVEAGTPDLDKTVYARFVADKYAYLEKDEINVALAVWKGQTHLQAAGATVSTVTVQKRSPDGAATVVGTFSLTESEPATPDGPRFVGKFSPSAAGLTNFNGYLRFSLSFTPRFMSVQQTELTVLYASERPATFTGAFTDGLRAGSVEVRVGIDVKKAGKYSIEGLLYDAKGEQPIALATFVGPLEAGMPDVPLTYYGLVFQDAKVAGPYTLKAVRGYMHDHTGDGHGPDLPEWTGSYVTKPYALADLTNAEWTSPQKAATVQAYKDHIVKLGGQP